MQNEEKITAVKPVASRPFSSFRTPIGSARMTSPEEAVTVNVVVKRPKGAMSSGDPSSTTETTHEHEQMGVDAAEQVVADGHLMGVQNRLSYDGYNWRKYGQKQVKGSEFPRSYYKCTYPACPVKRKVETTLDGQVAEIVYNGEHNHPKPHPPNNNPLSISEVVDYKKSTKDKQSSTAIALAEPAPACQSSAECEDAFHWRKYGQKAVKGNSFPRSYYRCSAARCNARKYVERSPDNSLVNTYAGRHNHGAASSLKRKPM